MTLRWSRSDKTATASRNLPGSKVHGAKVGSTWGRQEIGGSHVGPINFAIWIMITKMSLKDAQQELRPDHTGQEFERELISSLKHRITNIDKYVIMTYKNTIIG